MSAAVAGRIPASGLWQLAGSVVLLSSAWPITKIALEEGAAPLWFAIGRAGFSGLVAFLALSVTGRLRRPGRADLPALLAVGLLQLAGFFAFAHIAVAWVPAGRTVILANVTTIWIVPLSLLFLREPIPPGRWVAAILGVAGVAVLMSPWAIDWTVRETVIGHLFLLASAFCFAVAMIVVRRWPPRSSMLELLPWCFGLATLALLPLALWRGGGPGHWSGAAIGAMTYIAFAGPLGTWCVMQVAATLPAMVASVGFLLTPAAGLLLSNLLLGEPVGPDLLGGSALILAGVAFAARRPRGPRAA